MNFTSIRKNKASMKCPIDTKSLDIQAPASVASYLLPLRKATIFVNRTG